MNQYPSTPKIHGHMVENPRTAASPVLMQPFRWFIHEYHWLAVLATIGTMIYIGLSLHAALPYYCTPHLVEDDVAQHLTPFSALQDPQNFTDRHLVDYSKAYIPRGYYALYHLASPVMGPILFTKALGLTLLLLTWCLAFLTGKRIGGWTAGLASCLLTVHCHLIFQATFSGLFRSFSYPLLFLFIYLWISRRLRLAACALVAQALFYPPVFLLCTGAFASDFMRTPVACLTNRSRRTTAIIFAVAALIGLAAVTVMSRKPADYGDLITLEQAQTMPDWHTPLGRFCALPLESRIIKVYDTGRFGLHAGKYDHKLIKPIILANETRNDPFAKLWFLALAPFVLFARPRPDWFAALALCSVALYLLSRSVAFSLGWPDRFLRYCLPALTILLFPLAWNAISRSTKRFHLAGKLGLVFILAGVLFAYPAGAGNPRGLVFNTKAYQPLLTFLRDIDEPVLIAAWPRDTSDIIPIYTNKEVLIDYEHTQPLYLDFYKKSKKRIIDVLELIFATDLNTARQIRDKHKLTHLIVKKRVLALEGNTPRIFPPINDVASRLRRRVKHRNEFVFDCPPNSWTVYEDKYFRVIDLRQLGNVEK